MLRPPERDCEASYDLFCSQLPRSSSFEDELFFSVQIKGPTHEFSKRTTVLVKNTESLVFIQTDKQIYTPGQSGMKLYGVITQEMRCPP